MKKNKNTERQEEENKLKLEAAYLLRQMGKLKEQADINLNAIDRYFEKYPEDKIDDMSWEEKEKAVEEYYKLFRDLVSGRDELIKREKEYRTVRKKINDFYGCEKLKSQKISKTFDEMINQDEEEEDQADWWKRL